MTPLIALALSAAIVAGVITALVALARRDGGFNAHERARESATKRTAAAEQFAAVLNPRQCANGDAWLVGGGECSDWCDRLHAHRIHTIEDQHHA